MKKPCLILLLSFFIFAACAKTGEPSTVADVCRMDDGTLVAVEGFLVLPNFMNTLVSQKTGITTYELFLAAQPDGKSQSIKTSVSGTRGNEANRIAELPPEGFTQKDLRIFTDTGETIGSLDRVRVTDETFISTKQAILLNRNGEAEIKRSKLPVIIFSEIAHEIHERH